MTIGGWRGSPNSIAALLKHRVPLDSPKLRRCVRCKRVAMRGKPVCRHHDPHYRSGPDTSWRLASRTVAAMARRGLIPLELESLPVWRDLPVRTPSRIGDPLRLALLTLWDRRDDEPLRWAALWRQAMEAVRTGTKPGPERGP